MSQIESLGEELMQRGDDGRNLERGNCGDQGSGEVLTVLSLHRLQPEASTRSDKEVECSMCLGSNDGDDGAECPAEGSKDQVLVQPRVKSPECGGPVFKDQVRGARPLEQQQQQQHWPGDKLPENGGPNFKDQVRIARPQEQQQLLQEALMPRVVSVHRRPASHDQSSEEDEIERSNGPEGVVVPNAVLVESRSDVPLARLVPVHRYKIIFVLSILVVSAVVFVGVFCGTGNCSTELGNDQEPTQPPTTNQSLIDDIKSYINNITLSGSVIEYPVDPLSATNNELALQWLIEEDPLPLNADTAESRFRLQQHYALATLYFHFQGEFWTDSTGWLENPNECEWFRIQCSSESLEAGLGLQSVVSEIDFSFESTEEAFERTGNNLHGHIPEDISLLTSLTVLDLRSNAITGPFPDTIGLLDRLMKLDLGNNDLSGTIPTSIGGLSSLDTFGVDQNKLTGTLPEQIGQWYNLTAFFVEFNNLWGSLPASIGNWTNLIVFKVDNNAFEGKLPDSIGHWTMLQWFFVYVNDLTGTLPDSIGNWSNLNAFSVFDNGFSGTLPDSIGKWTNIWGFYVNQNALNGTIPESVGNWSNIGEAEFNQNAFTGTITESICNWGDIQHAYFYWNALEGTMPGCICNVTSLTDLAADCSEVGCSCCNWCSEDF